ncbi:glutamate--tRNA ligase [marine bacterium AO1-C]|nr:glutamate--tRNA ligase [marine bacterium AO1-C]
MDRPVRVRFAPSPTGALHIGGVRTALYNYLFARKEGGKFILRIEDTDQNRYVAGAEEYIMESLEWLGITPDESPVHGGEYGPYRQSERKEMYRQYAEQLVEAGHAYYAFDTAAELDAMRKELEAAKSKNPTYNAITRKKMKNSFTLSEEEVKQRIESGEPYVIRIKMPHREEIRFKDIIRGWVMVHGSTLDDKVLMKGDGMPTYHLANVVDDYLMKISHVIRGEEWLPSLPLHVTLYKFLGWENEMPEFAHLPLLLNPPGKEGKLSKRQADKLGVPVFPLPWQDPNTGEQYVSFKEEGFLTDALLNFLALLGWNPGNNQEIFDLNQLEMDFDLEGVNKAGIKFDYDKARWFNEEYIKVKKVEDLVPYLMDVLRANGIDADVIDQKQREQIVSLFQNRVTLIPDFWDKPEANGKRLAQAQVLFNMPAEYDEKTVRKKWTGEAADLVEAYKMDLSQLENWVADDIKTTLEALLTSKGVGLGKVMPAVRVAITGAGKGPDLMTVMEIIGKEETIKRLEKALMSLEQKVS